MKMTRREYLLSDCFTHFAKVISRQVEEIRRQGDEISELNEEVSSVRCELESSENVKTHQSEQLVNLTYDVAHVRNQLESSKVVISDQQEEIRILKMLNKQSNSHWQAEDNVTVCLGQSYTLECSDKYNYARAKLFYPLKKSNSSFRIEILSLNVGEYPMVMGLTHKGRPNNSPVFIVGTVGYCSNGAVLLDGRLKKTVQRWKNGDIVTCGIKLPSFVKDGIDSVEVFFSINEQIVLEEVMKKPQNGFFPSISIFKGDKVKHLCN